MTPGVAARFPQAGLATPHVLASAAGAAELGRGGNAIDAIVAANLALGVVAPYLCGYGGDIFAIVWDGGLHGYLGSGRSPAAATVEKVTDLLGDTPLLVGPHAVTVPGAIAGWFELLERWGTRDFGELAQDAIRYARDGFELTPMGAFSCIAYRGLYEGLDDWQAVYAALEPGDVLRQPALANLIELLAKDGPAAYYEGAVADAITAAVQRHGGLLERSDLAAHTGEWTAPMRAAYRDVEVAQLPPPTQGVAVLEIMRILDGFDLAALDPVARAHVVIEAVKLGLRDRDDHVTDPEHLEIPPEALLADDWIATRRVRHRRHARFRPRAGSPAARWDRVPVRRGWRRAARQSHPVELPRVRIRSPRAGVGDQPQQPGLVVLARPVAGERARAVEAADAHADPGRWC